MLNKGYEHKRKFEQTNSNILDVKHEFPPPSNTSISGLGDFVFEAFSESLKDVVVRSLASSMTSSMVSGGRKAGGGSGGGYEGKGLYGLAAPDGTMSHSHNSTNNSNNNMNYNYNNHNYFLRPTSPSFLANAHANASVGVPVPMGTVSYASDRDTNGGNVHPYISHLSYVDSTTNHNSNNNNNNSINLLPSHNSISMLSSIYGSDKVISSSYTPQFPVSFSGPPLSTISSSGTAPVQFISVIAGTGNNLTAAPLRSISTPNLLGSSASLTLEPTVSMQQQMEAQASNWINLQSKYTER